MTRLGVVLGLLLLAVPASAGPMWRQLAPGPIPQSWGFATSAVESEGQGRIFFHFDSPTHLFNPMMNVWEEQTAHHFTSRTENTGTDWDETNKIFWIGNCAPCGGIDGVPTSGNIIQTYDPATGIYVNRTATEPGGGCGLTAQYSWYNNALFCWGGYNGSYGTDLRRKVTSPDGPWTYLGTTNMPPLYIDRQEGSRYTNYRGGVNRPGGYLWTVAAHNELYKCPLSGSPPTCTAWVKVPTTGVKPTSSWLSYTLDESRNKIVGFVGCDSEASACDIIINQTYLLDLATNVWSLGPGPSAPHPVTSPMAEYIPLYDRVRHRVLWLNRASLWWYDDDGTGPPAVDTVPAAPTGLTISGTPPPTNFTLMTTKSGAGTGTVTSSPGGINCGSDCHEAYPINAQVQLFATSGSGSACVAWSGPGCGATVTITTNMTCNAEFTTTVPPSTCAITAGIFTFCDAPPVATNSSPFSSGTKDIPSTYDSTRNHIIVGTGDFTTTFYGSSGQNLIFSYDPSTNVWGLVSPNCHGPGLISPPRPTDVGPLMYDPKRDALWLVNGSGYAGDGAICTEAWPPGSPTGSTYRTGVLGGNPVAGGTLRLDLATGVWTLVSPNAYGNVGGSGHYDAATDSMLALEANAGCPGTGSGSLVISLALSSMTKTPLAGFCITNSPIWPTGPSGTGWDYPSLPEHSYHAWNPVTRTLYVVGRAPHIGVSAVDGYDVVFAKYERATNIWTRLASPPLIGSAANLTATRTKIIWDSVHQKVHFPVVTRINDPDSTCAWVDQFLTYNPTTNTWTDVPVTFEMHTDTLMYSPADDVVVMGGGGFCQLGATNLHGVSLYRSP